jgi:hypothetical protein
VALALLTRGRKQRFMTMEKKSFMDKCQALAHWFLTQTAWGKFTRKHRTAMYVTLFVELVFLALLLFAVHLMRAHH